MSLNVKKGDNVKILTGKDKGKTGKIIASSPSTGRVVVDNCNIITKHTKARSAQAQSAINKVPGPIDASNVQIICPSCNKTTRVANTIIDGKKQRTCKHCQMSLDIKVKEVEKKAKKTKKADATTEDAETPVKKTVKKTTAKKTTATSDKE